MESSLKGATVTTVLVNWCTGGHYNQKCWGSTTSRKPNKQFLASHGGSIRIEEIRMDEARPVHVRAPELVLFI